MNRIPVSIVLLVISAAAVQPSRADEPRAIEILFLGDNGHHQPPARFKQLQPVLAKRGIAITYTDDLANLNTETLSHYDGLAIYANTTEIKPEQEKALLDFVAGGKGLIALHCASYCFLNSPAYVELVGGQFKRHGTGTFSTEIVRADHPIMRGFGGFESWDETYVHDKHNDKNRIVLSYRVDGEGREPWTWVRTQGKGRVFYTAWGHDERTWGNPGFQNLVERGIRWAVGGDPGIVPAFTGPNIFPVPAMTALRTDVKPFEFTKANVPFYPPGKNWGTTEDGLFNMQLPLPPEESIKHIVTPVGFEPQLFAAEPDIVKPICMAWDERGRLWIGETLDYPNQLQPEGEGRDRIKICEDTDGDGRADKFTVFAERLSMPTSIAFWHGGAIVQNGTQTLYLKDTDGDDRADERRVLISGWTMGDTHGGVSNFQYGLDNWIWAMQGYNNSQPTVAGKRHPYAFRMGFFRFRPDGSELEFVRSTDNNTWGLGISEEGLVFGSTANHNPSVYMPIANRYYEAVAGWSAAQLGTIADTHLFKPITERIRQVDQHGGYTAGAGHAVYTARTYPREYWNRTAFVCGPTGHLVGTFLLKRDGADFHSTSPCNLLASNDEWTAPIMAEVGPDGNVWVIDWYNYIVQHNPTPRGFKTGKGNAYETELRDKRHGRIYRVVYKAAAPQPPMSLGEATPEQLVAALRHPTMLWRKHAQRLLVERGKTDVVPALIGLVKDTSVDEIGLNVGAIHALWTLHGLNAVEGEAWDAVNKALLHPSAAVRRNAVLVLPDKSESYVPIGFSGVLEDSDPQVRLAALLKLSELPANQTAAEELFAMLDRPENSRDRWISDAATAAAATNAPLYLATVARLSDDRIPPAVAIVAEHYARGAPSDSIGSLLLELSSAEPSVANTIVNALAKGWPKNTPAKLDEDAERAMATLITRLDAGAKGQLIRLATAWGSKGFEKYAAEITASLLKTAGDEEAPENQRISAAQQLIGFAQSSDDVAVKLLKLVTPQTPPTVATGLIEALGGSDAPALGSALIANLPTMTPAAKAAAIRVLLGRPQTTEVLLAAIADRKLDFGELTLEQRQSLASHPNREIARRAQEMLASGGGLPNPDRQKVLDELMPLTEETGDALAGKEVLKKQCLKCHTHSGEGARIGPDLTGMAVHPKHELLTHIIDPSRSVEGNFRVYSVITIEGKILTGLLASESKTAIELFDVEGKKHEIQRDEIDEIDASRKSLMPEGFEKQISRDDLRNLLEFLTQRGKFLPLPLGKAATFVSTKSMFYGQAEHERMIFPNWAPVEFEGVPFQLVDPQGDRVPNIIMLYGPQGTHPPKMPKSVSLPCNAPAKAIHLLSGVSGWGFPAHQAESVSMIVRLHYADGSTEDHPLKNKVHFADYIRRVDVPGSKFAFQLRGQQLRYFAVYPQRADEIAQIEFVKGPDATAPLVMAVTVESQE